MHNVVISLPSFNRRAAALGFEPGHVAGVVAEDPTAGDLIQRGRGLRKLRLARPGTRGKSGGARVIYYFHSEAMPTVLLMIFAKADRENLTAAELSTLVAIVGDLLDRYQP
ncbi:MAG: type II toxin-antitoxin system RelE/ParE family toxin [Proteobacteria bacterium]|nr:type II toxin-antitoxin system RelE/ParE family toxin [Pseudomonadota bacterium]